MDRSQHIANPLIFESNDSSRNTSSDGSSNMKSNGGSELGENDCVPIFDKQTIALGNVMPQGAHVVCARGSDH